MGRMGPSLLASLFDVHAAALALYARQWCDGPEDIVQEAFVKLARQRPPPDRAVPWLYRVVRNGAIAASRHDLPLVVVHAMASTDDRMLGLRCDRQGMLAGQSGSATH